MPVLASLGVRCKSIIGRRWWLLRWHVALNPDEHGLFSHTQRSQAAISESASVLAMDMNCVRDQIGSLATTDAGQMVLEKRQRG